MAGELVASAALLVLRVLSILAGYLTNNNAFPKPLSEEEEAECLEAMRRGCEEARNKLIEHNLRLVAHIVKKFDNTGEDPDDLISIGTVGLIKAIDTYDVKKGTRLATYAAKCIENEILMHLRALKRKRFEVYLYDPIGSDKEGNEVSLVDLLGTEGDIVADEVGAKFERRALLSKVSQLCDKERLVVEMRYGLRNRARKTQREIAERLGISRSYVSRIEKKAVRKLIKQFSET